MRRYQKQLWFGIVFLGILLVFFFYYKTAQPKRAQTDKTDKKISNLIKQKHVSGTLLLAADHKVTSIHTYGDANHSTNKANQKAQLYPIASLQKLYTAVIVGQLIEEHRLRYDSKLSDFVKTAPQADKVTVEQLLSHTSGYSMPETAPSTLLTTESTELRNAIQHTTFSDKQTYAYSNVNYTYLAAIIADLEQKSYQAVVHKRLLDKWQLAHTLFWDELPATAFLPNEYRYDEATKQEYTQKELQYSQKLMSSLLGAGNLYSNVEDLWRFQSLLTTNKLLTAQTTKKILLVSGFMDPATDKIRFSGNISADGQRGGFGSVIYGDPDTGKFVIFLGNQTAHANLNDIAETIYSYTK